jgi:hypothetical protein
MVEVTNKVQSECDVTKPQKYNAIPSHVIDALIEPRPGVLGGVAPEKTRL